MASLSGQTLMNPYRSYYLSNPVEVLTFTGTPELEFSNVNGKIEGINGNGDALSTSVWSDYPTLSNNIIFDASNNLTVVGGNLYFNGNLLAQAGQISNVADWYLYPALTGNVLLNAGVGVSFNGVTLARSGTDLRWNGASVLPSTWSAYPATQNVNMNGFQLESGSNKDLTMAASNTATVSGRDVNIAAFENNIIYTSSNTISAGGGIGGVVALRADSAGPGVNTGGKVLITANGGSNGAFVFGGLIELDANTGGYGEYGAATSAIKLSAAGVNIYAGAIPSFGSLAGYIFNYGMLGINDCVGLPSVVPSLPGTRYLYATGGVGYGGIRMESPAGVEMVNSTDFYAYRIYPYYNSFLVGTHPDLLISGRSNAVGNNQYLKLDMCSSIGMASNAVISNVSTISFSNSGSISNVNVINMSNGSLCNVSNINGAAYPPATPPPSNWSLYPATSVVNFAGFNLSNVSTINGVAYTQVSNWANYPAVNIVDCASNVISNAGGVKLASGGLTYTGGIRMANGFQGSGTAVQAYDYTSSNSADIRTDNVIFSEYGGTTANDIFLTSLYAGGSGQKSRFNVFWSDSIGTPKNDTIAYLTDVYFRPTNDLYVAPNGSDSAGDGSQMNPYQTITKALTVRGTLGAGPIAINIASGTYTENPTLSTAGTYLIALSGTADPATDPVTIIGTVTCSATNTGLTNLSITGTVSTTGTANAIALNNITVTNASGFAITGNTQTSITNSRVTSSGTGCANITAGGTLTVLSCVFVASVGSCVQATGTLITRDSSFTSTNATASASPIIRFVAGATSTANELAFCKVVYTSQTTDTGGLKCCVRFENTGTVGATITQCYFDCRGATTASGGNIQCIQNSGGGTTNLLYGNIQAVSPPHHIAPTVTKTAMVEVP